jgi:hypothetical protein
LAERVRFGTSHHYFGLAVIALDGLDHQASTTEWPGRTIGAVRPGGDTTFAIDGQQFAIGASIAQAAEQIAGQNQVVRTTKCLYTLTTVVRDFASIT